jgi:hypothetical protein
MATATLATKAMVAGATVSQDMPVSAGVAAAAGIAVDMAVAAMAAAATVDDREVRQQPQFSNPEQVSTRTSR